MPIVTVDMIKGRTVDQKRKLAKDITDLLVSNLNVKPEVVSVVYNEYEKENWASAGTLYCDK